MCETKPLGSNPGSPKPSKGPHVAFHAHARTYDGDFESLLALLMSRGFNRSGKHLKPASLQLFCSPIKLTRRDMTGILFTIGVQTHSPTYNFIESKLKSQMRVSI